MKSITILFSRILKNGTTIDFLVALAWTFFAGLPLFTLHMLVLDYEHSIHGMSPQFSFEMSLKNMFPYHPISIALWLIVVFIAAFSVRRAFRKQSEIVVMKGMVERSQDEADTDGLTGVMNRRAFDRHFKSSLEYAKLQNQPLTIVMMDVDEFKSLNDHYGHINGDKVLRSVADYLTRFVRAQDIVARYGGDEFVIICPGLSKEGAKSMVHRLKITTHPMEFELSVGIATYPPDGQSMTEIMEFADRSMYRDKEEHRTKRRMPVLAD